MPRIRQFNPEHTLQKAMHIFWIKGFRHTSLANLVEATGVGKKGLYSVFGSKFDLYLKALEYYKCVQAEELLTEIENDHASLDEIKNLFERTLNFTQSEIGSRGCMVCNAIVEFSDKEPLVWRSTANHLDRFRNAISNALFNAISKKEIPLSVDIKKHSNFLVGVLQGLMLMSWGGSEYMNMKDTVELSLKSLK